MRSLVATTTKRGSAAGQAQGGSGAGLDDTVIVLEHRQAGEGSAGLEPDRCLQLPLTAEERTVVRGRRQSRCGRPLLLQLPRDGALQPGDRLWDGQRCWQVEVQAAPEPLLRVEADSSLALLQAAYHLGNRHVALELHEAELLLLQDSVLETMLRSRGLRVSVCEQPFVPEGGAYGGGHSHSHSHSHSHHHSAP